MCWQPSRRCEVSTNSEQASRLKQTYKFAFWSHHPHPKLLTSTVLHATPHHPNLNLNLTPALTNLASGSLNTTTTIQQ